MYTAFVAACAAYDCQKLSFYITLPLASADEYSLLHATVGFKGSDIRYPLACSEALSTAVNISNANVLKVNISPKITLEYDC